MIFSASHFMRVGRSSVVGRRAFSLIEMMVTIGLLGFIIIGLVAMFSYTSRAFRAGLAQTDVLESGRAATDILARDLETATAASLRYPLGGGSVTNFAVKFFNYTQVGVFGTTVARTNELESIFLLTQENQRWTGVGYVLALPNKHAANLGLGSLYRWQSSTTNNPQFLAELFRRDAFNAISNVQQFAGNYRGTATNIPLNLERVCDGVVHLRFLTFAPAGQGGYLVTNDVGANIFARTNGNSLGAIEAIYTSNALPAHVEFELALLETDALKKFLSLPDAVKTQYLARDKTATHVHVFRRRVAVHNVQPEVYK
ncbi:MAG: hypothetical protein RL380_676 [Verrucomicrobiota bacterium]